MNKNLLSFFLLFTVFVFSQNKNSSVGFIENKGQIIDQKGKPNNDVKYLLNTNGLNVQIRKNGFSYDVYETKKHKLSKKEIAKQNPFPDLNGNKEKLLDYKLEYSYHRIDIDFVNSKKNVKIIAEEKSADYDNYYNVIAKPDGVLDVHKFKKITYKNIYDNIDVVFTIPNDSLKPVEYNFVVRPNGKISDIQLKFKGAKTELVDNKIKMNVRFGAMEEVLPMSWIEDEKSKTEVAINYKNISKNVYGFDSDLEVSDKTLIIDPVPIRLWGTLYGDVTNSYSLRNVNNTVDIVGNLYMTGTTSASNMSFATIGAHQTSIPTSQYPTTNGIIVKFDTNGARLWGTYYGGPSSTDIIGIKVDLQNNIIITGTTDSLSNISTIGTHKANLPYGIDAFIAKFNNMGVRLWGTYFGGDFTENSFGLNVDYLNNIYIVGVTTSTNGVAYNSNFQSQLNLNSFSDVDAFIAKFDPTGNLIWGTYVGGENRDEITAIAIKDNYLVTVGNTNSDTKIATNGVFQENRNINQLDGFVCKFTTNGSRIWSTYYGGESIEEFFAVEIDDDNNIYIGGLSASSNNMTTTGSFQQTNLGVYRGLFAKLSSSGSRIWGSYLGGANVHSIIFKNNSIYLGATGSQTVNQNLTNSCAYDLNTNYETKGYIGKFSKNCDFIWGSFVGGDSGIGGNVEGLGTKISLDNNSNIYVSGITRSNYLISDNNSHQQAVLGNNNYYAMKFYENVSSITNASNNSPTCTNSTLNLSASGGTNYSWTGPNGFTSSLQNPTIPNAQAINSGQYTCIITGTGGCDGPVSTTVVVGDTVKPIPNLATLPTITGDCNTIISTIPTATDNCAGNLNGTTTDALSYTLPGTYTINWKYDDGNGNIETQTQTVTINDLALPTAAPNQTFCIQDNATINSIAITGQSIKWYDAATLGNLVSASTLLVDATTYYASQTLNGCESLRIPVTITIQNTVAPTTANANQTFCATQNATLSNIAISGIAVKWYETTTSTAALPSNTVLTNATTYYASQTIDNCESVSRLPIAISLITTLNAVDYSKSYCDDLDDGFENILLSDFYLNLLPTYTNEIFSFYTVANSAENELLDDKISINYKLETGNHSIYVRIDSVNGCHEVVKLNLTLFTAPIINLKDIVPICENKNITVNVGSGYDSYTWSNGIINQSSIIITQPGSFSVTVTKNNGSIICSTTKNFEVVKSNIASILSIETSDWTNDQNSISVILSASSVGDYEYSLDGIKYQDSPVFENLNSGFYTVYVNDKNNCGEIKEDAFLLMYPAFFTPNGDGFNDYWKIKFSEIEPELSVKIFDRYGKLIKILNNSEQGWDGTFNQKQLPADDYWFVISRRNGKTYKNHFSLKR